MHLELKRLYRQTASYTVGNLLYRGASFLLIPLYAHQLAPSEYGTLELVTTTTYLIQSLFMAGVAHSALRFYYEYDAPRDKNAVISSTFIATICISSLLAILLSLFAPVLSHLILGSPDYTYAFRLTALLMVFEVSREISLMCIRAKERVGLFILVSVLQLFVQVGATMYTVAYLKLGLYGILIGNLIATATIWAVLSIFTVSQCGLRFEFRKLTPIAKYTGPLILSALGSSAFQYLDRFALNAFVSLTALGMYAFTLRLSNLIPILIILPLTNSYGPFRFAIMKQPNARQVYARVVTYYVFAASFVLAAIASVSKELLKLFAQPEYWPAYMIVPLMLVPGAIGGIQYCLQTGIYIEKKTKYFFHVAVATGAVNVVLIFLLVPRFGLMGAALSLFGSAIYGVAHTFVAGQRVFPVAYEYGRLVRILITAVVIGTGAFYLPIENPWAGLLVKLLLILTIPLILLVTGIITPDEREAIRGRWQKVTMKTSVVAETASSYADQRT